MKLDFPIAITKMSGAGNDFIVIDHRSGFIPEPYQPQFAQLVCRHSFSVGADGLILIEENATEDFGWRFYNKDGSVAEMCGNGARCAARFAWRHGIAGRRMRFSTLAGVIEAELIGEQEHVRIGMTEPFDYRDSMLIHLGESEKEVFFVNTGVPHAVVFVDSDNTPVEKWGRTLRYHEQFEPAGTNAGELVLAERTPAPRELVLGRTVPSRASSPTTMAPSGLGISPEAASTPMAMARSWSVPALGMWAGARFTVTVLFGKLIPEEATAARTRSFASRTAVSGSPLSLNSSF